MAKLDKILLKVGSRCNINCSYCYVYNLGDDGWVSMPNIMGTNTISAIVKSLRDFSKIQSSPFSIILHGGEPLLIGAEKLKILLKSLRSFLSEDYSIGIQTNGILINDDILDICSEYRTRIAISLDGPKYIHDRFRLNHKEEGTYDEVISGLQKLINHPEAEFLNNGILAVIDPTSNPSDVYHFFKGLGVSSLDFLYHDGNHSTLPQGKSSFDSTEYGNWLASLLDTYLEDENPIRISMLDEMMKILLREESKKGESSFSDYEILVIETDGTYSKNDILKSAYNHADRFQRTWSVENYSIEELLNSDEFLKYHQQQFPTASNCLSCPELSVCGGGLPGHRWKKENSFDNESIYCMDQKHLVGHIRKKISEFGIST